MALSFPTGFGMHCATIACVLFSVANGYGASPEENLSEWYSEWLHNVPQSYSAVFTQYFGHPKGKPLVMSVSNWENPPSYRLCAVTNSKRSADFRRIVNPSYFAAIESPLNTSPAAWHITEFVSRQDQRFSERSNSGGSSPDFLGPTDDLFNAPHEVVARPMEDNSRVELEVTFKKTNSSRPRDLEKLLIELDKQVGGMPVQVKRFEFGGIKSRTELSGWHQDQGVWLYNGKRTFVTLIDSPTEQLHSSETWEFGDSDGTSTPENEEQCYLTYYNLPEPADAGSSWSIVVFVLALVACIAGYVTIANRNAASKH